MADDDVPLDEMRWMSTHMDPIDAVLGGDPLDEDLLDVATIVHDVRATFLSREPLHRHPALAAFTEAHLDAATNSDQPVPAVETAAGPAGNAGRSGGTRNKLLGSIAAFAATLAGKVLLGTAATAASVGTLHATGVVDVPVLPDNAGSTVQEQPDDGETGNRQGGGSEDPGANGEAGKETATQNKEAAQAYTGAVQEWTDCVSDAASGQGDAETRTTGGFDRKDECGDRPQPADFGLTDLPSQAADAARSGGEGADESAPGQASVPEPPGSTNPAGSSTGPPSGDPDTPATSEDTEPPASGTPAGTAPGSGNPGGKDTDGSTRGSSSNRSSPKKGS